MTVKPEKKCKMCCGQGHVMFWDSKKRGTYTRGNNLESTPCTCLIKNYQKIKTDLKPEFVEDNGQLVIKLTEKEETGIKKSEK